MTSEIQAKVTQQGMGYFHQVKGLLQSLSNTILEKRVLQKDEPQREIEVSIGKKVWMIKIPSQVLTPWDGDSDATLHKFDLINLNINELLMHMVSRIQNEASHEI